MVDEKIKLDIDYPGIQTFVMTGVHSGEEGFYLLVLYTGPENEGQNELFGPFRSLDDFNSQKSKIEQQIKREGGNIGGYKWKCQ